jgi:hypothetical protein
MSTEPERHAPTPAPPVQADLVVAATACATRAGLQAIADAVQAGVAPKTRVALCHPEAAGIEPTGRPPEGAVQFLPTRLPGATRLPLATQNARDLTQALSAVCHEVGASACVVIGALPEAVTPDGVRSLAEPMLGSAIDLVLPNYTRHRLDGLINSGVVYPLTRALYGRRVDGQLGLDFGLSRRMLDGLSQSAGAQRPGRTLWLLTEAVARGLTVGQAQLGAYLPPVEQTTDVSAALSGVLGALFEDMERQAPLWQRIRGSQTVPTSGTAAGGEPAAPFFRRPIDADQHPDARAVADHGGREPRKMVEEGG